MVTILPSEDCVFRLDSKYGFSHAANLPVTFTDVTLDDRGFGFNGSSSHIDCGSSNGLKLSYPYSVEFEYTPSHISTESGYILGLLMSSSFKFGSVLDYLHVGPSGDRAGLNRSEFVDGVKSHVVITYQSSGIIAYHNGIDKTVNTGDFWGTSSSFQIGSRDISNHVAGIIDRVSLYNRAISAQEVADRYNKYTFGGHL